MYALKLTFFQENDAKENGHTDHSDVKADAVEEDKSREQALPSNILEKGIVSFSNMAFVTFRTCAKAGPYT